METVTFGKGITLILTGKEREKLSVEIAKKIKEDQDSFPMLTELFLRLEVEGR